MKIEKRTLTWAVCMLGLFGVSNEARANLVVSSSGGVGVVHSSVSNVTWMQDGNLLGSFINARGFDAVFNDIVALVPTVTTSISFTPQVHTIVPGDFANFIGEYGRANFYGARAFTLYLNASSYGGHNQWRLPSANNGVYPNPVLDFYTKAGDFGQLYYDELPSSAGFGFQDPNGYFNNEQYAQYWSSWFSFPAPYDYIEAPSGFNLTFGDQYYLNPDFKFYVWPVASGTIAAVPESAGWMMAVASGTVVGVGLTFKRWRARRISAMDLKNEAGVA